MIGLDRNSATLCGGTGPRGARRVPAHITTLPLQLATQVNNRYAVPILFFNWTATIDAILDWKGRDTIDY